MNTIGNTIADSAITEPETSRRSLRRNRNNKVLPF